MGLAKPKMICWQVEMRSLASTKDFFARKFEPKDNFGRERVPTGNPSLSSEKIRYSGHGARHAIVLQRHGERPVVDGRWTGCNHTFIATGLYERLGREGEGPISEVAGRGMAGSNRHR
jgi:hypothetical protein